MVAAAALVRLCLLDEGVVLWRCIVEVAHGALGDHGLDLALENGLQALDQVDFGAVGIFEDGAVEQDLIGLAEAKLDLILVHQLAVGLCALELHGDGRLGASRVEVVVVGEECGESNLWHAGREQEEKKLQLS